MFKRVLIFTVLMFLTSCKESNSTLFNFGDSTFTAPVYSQNSNGINFSIAKVPNEYFIEKSDFKEIDLLEFEDVFIYELLTDDSSDLMKTKSNLEFDEVVQHMSQQIFEDFVAVNKKGEQIPCQGVTHERTFQVRPQERLILYFKRTNDSPIEQIIYTDRLYGAGQVTHTLKEQNLNYDEF